MIAVLEVAGRSKDFAYRTGSSEERSSGLLQRFSDTEEGLR